MRLTSALSKTLLVCLSVMAVLLAAEGLFRLVNPQRHWPGYDFIEGVGILHKLSEPGVNRLGFMDKERQVDKPADVYRILLLGDSFVDGMNVDVYLERELAKLLPHRKFEVIPMGISGTGTLEHLMFYEKIGRQFHPDMVIDIFVPNDFTNNSNVLESVRLRFDPFKPGRNFVQKVATASGPVMEAIPPVADYQRHILKELPAHPQQSMFRLLENRLNTLFSGSRFYDFIKQRLYFIDAASLYHRFDGEYAYRISQLNGLEAVKPKLAGWNYPQDLDFDGMFLADGDDLPPAFTDAIEYTAYAFRRFRQYAAEDSFVFVEVFTDSCTYFPKSWLEDWRKAAESGKRSINPENFRKRLEQVVRAEQIEFYDLYPTFVRRGDLTRAHLPNDNHWNETGKHYAAEDMAAVIAKRLSP